jgi:arsenate reductase
VVGGGGLALASKAIKSLSLNQTPSMEFGGLNPMSRPLTDFPITVFHIPACGTSRNVLALLAERGWTPEVVEYLKTGRTRPQLEGLVGAMGVRARDIMREKGTPAAELGLLDPDVSDATILEAMTRLPILVNRPIVVTPRGAALCRPADKVLALLP